MKIITPFYSTFIPISLHEFTSAPGVVAASLVATKAPLPKASEIHRDDSITVTFSSDPFGSSFPETILLSGIHPTIGLDIQNGVDRHRFQLVTMVSGTPSHWLPQCKSRLRHAFLLSVNQTPVDTISDICGAIAQARQTSQPSIVVVFTKGEATNNVSNVGLPQLYVYQLHVMKEHIAYTVQSVVHKAITVPTCNRHSLQKQLQLDNYAKQVMFGPYC
jgi:hypothetical protein